MYKLTVPIEDDEIRALKVGDSILLNGVILTGRDAVHKWLLDTFVIKTREATPSDVQVFQQVKALLMKGVIYHCGPIVSNDDNQYRFVAAGPTTSIREEPYQADVMKLLNIKAVIGKGGMGEKTLAACKEVPAVYLHAVGGAAAVIAKAVKKVLAVHKLEFGIPEAIWVIEVEDFPAVVTMDAHGNSLHADVEARSKEVLGRLLTL